MPIRCSAFVATSLDGYIARADGSIDWLSPYGDPTQDKDDGHGDYGYGDFSASVDTVILGRNTFELVSTFPSWPYSGKKVVILSSRELRLPEHLEGKAQVGSGHPAELTRRLEGQGCRHAYVDGGKTIQGFLEAGLLQEITIARIPILIGDGIPLFGRLDHDLRMELVESRAYPTGVVQSRYRILAAGG